MKTEFKKSFLRDIKKIKDSSVLEWIYDAIVSVESASTLQDIPELKKLKGARKGIYYRIKVDGYRIGITIENETVTFAVFRKRSEIYRHFP